MTAGAARPGARSAVGPGATPRGARRPRSRPGPADWVLVAGLVVQLAPFLLLPTALTQDGPAHVDGAWVLLHHGDPGAAGAALRHWFATDLRPVPNMLVTLLLAGLMTVLSPDVAEKVLLAAIGVLLVAGLRGALGAIDPRARWLAVAALPLVGSELFVFGFYNFCLGTGLFLVALGWALARRTGWTAWATAGLALLLVLSWATHLLPWLITALALGVLGAARALAAARVDGSAHRWWPAVGTHLLPPVLAVVPSGVLTAVYALTSRAPAGRAAGPPTWARVGRLLSQYRPLVVGSDAERPAAWVVAGCLVVLLVAARRRGTGPGAAPVDRLRAVDRRVLGGLAGAAALAYLLTPDELGPDYGYLPDRLAWFPPLLVVLFAATRPPSLPAVRRAVAALLVLAAAGGTAVRLPTQLRDTRTAEAVLSAAGEIPPGATFVVLRYGRYRADVASLGPGAHAPNPLQHLSSRLAVRAQAVDVGLYEAVTPYFQVRWRPGADLRRRIDPDLGGAERVPPRVDLAAAGGALDYVVVVGLDGAAGDLRDSTRLAQVRAALTADYEPVSRSRHGHDVAVWRLRPQGPG